MQHLKLAIPLTASVLFLGCTIQLPSIPKLPQIQSSPTRSEAPTPDTPDITVLKEAVKELDILEDKIENGINYKAYSDIISTSQPAIEKASGESKAVAAVKSAFEGHKLASQLWQCDGLEGYKELHQCRGKALAGIFAKYPDIKVQAKASVQGEDFSTISTRLDKEEILQAIWEKISVEAKVARQAISLNTAQKEAQP
ncbi:MAG: hypothetical protein LDL41_14985 [Coleofasciculus sp. S288]|nr:hypothetical protein [Coleofasciculus sp. S288]